MARHRPLPTTRREFLRLAAGAGLALPSAAALGGCTGNSGGALGGSADGGKVTELVHPVNESPWLPAYEKLTARYARTGDVDVTLRVFPYDGLRTQMTNVVQSGNTVFDLFEPDEPWTAQFYANGWVTPFTDIDSSFTLDPEIFTYDALPYWDAERKVSAEGGTVMGMPLNGNVALLVYRKDLYDELGLTVPTTWEEAWENGRRAQQSGKVRYGYVTRGEATQGGQSVTYDFMPVLYSYGGTWFADEGTDWTPTVDTDEAVAALEMFRRLLALGPAQPHTVGQDEVISALQSGECLQGHVVAAAAADLEDPQASNVAGRLGYAVVPAGPGGSPAPTSGTWSLCVPSDLPDDRARAALDFITWVGSREAQVAFARAGGIPTRRDAITDPGVPATYRAFLDPLAESLRHVRRAVRYPFATPMLEHTEQALSAVAAGRTSARSGLSGLQRQLSAVVREAGLPTA